MFRYVFKDYNNMSNQPVRGRCGISTTSSGRQWYPIRFELLPIKCLAGQSDASKHRDTALNMALHCAIKRLVGTSWPEGVIRLISQTYTQDSRATHNTERYEYKYRENSVEWLEHPTNNST